MSAERPRDSKVGPVGSAGAAATSAVGAIASTASTAGELPSVCAAMLSNGLGVKLEVMSILKTGNKASAPIGIPKSLDSASEETASKSKTGATRANGWRALLLEAVSDTAGPRGADVSLMHDG